jgi:hypothetical protein
VPEQPQVILSAAVEGIVDEAVVRRLVQEVPAIAGAVHVKNGKTQLRAKVEGYNNAARFHPWIVLVDLDHETDCAPLLRAAWVPAPAPLLAFSVAVREVEAWLLADRQRLAQFLHVAVQRVPKDPDAVEDPKQMIIQLAAHSRSQDVREDMVPRPGSGRHQGPAYASRLIEFAQTHWRPDFAEKHSDSLRRCRRRLRRLVAEFQPT